MNTENYQKTLDDLTFARDTMQRQLKTAGPYEGMLVLQVIRQLADTTLMIQGMLEASQYADSLINLR